MKREEIKKPDYTAGIRHSTVGSDRHDVRREDFRNKTVPDSKTPERSYRKAVRLFCDAGAGIRRLHGRRPRRTTEKRRR